MDPNDPENSNICGKTPATWLNEICQKTNCMVKTGNEEDLRRTSQEKPSFKVTLEVHQMEDGCLIGIGEGIAQNKKDAKHRASIDLLNKLGYTKEKLTDMMLEPSNKGQIPVEKMKETGESQRQPPAPVKDKEEYVGRLKQVCAEHGLPEPDFKVVNVTGSSNNPLTTIEGEVPRRGIIMNRIYHVEEDYGKQKTIKHVVARELLKQIYVQEEKILASVIDWANESEENTKKLPQEFITSLSIRRNPLEGFDIEKFRMKQCDLVNCNDLFVHDFHSFQATFKSSKLELAFKDLQLFEDPCEVLADIIQEQLRKGHFCEQELEVICDEENWGLVSLKLTFNSWVFNYHGHGTSIELATNDAAKRTLIFLKESLWETEESVEVSLS